MIRAILCTASLLAVRSAALGAADATDLDGVLQRVREATGVLNWSDQRGAVRLEGTGNFLGSDATTEVIIDAQGRFVFRRSGRIDMADSFDGRTVWRLDLGGEAYPLSLGEREQTLFGGYAATNLWFDPRFGMKFTLNGPSVPEGDTPIVLGFSLDGWLLDGVVEIDPRTWLPVKWTTDAGVSRSEWTLDGTVEVDGIRLPARVAQLAASGGHVSYAFTRATRVPSVDPTVFAIGPRTPRDSRFDPTAPATLETKRAPTGHVLVRPLVNGRDIGWFIFDTGAGINVLDTTAARDLNCDEVGVVPAVGASGTVQSKMLRAGSMTLGPLSIDNPLFIGIDFAGISAAMGEKIAGVIGFPVIWRSITEYDAERATVSLHDPAAGVGFRGVWSPLTLYNRHSCVPARFAGGEGTFVLDTGAGSSTVLFHEPAVRRLRLLDGRRTTESKRGGVGGFHSVQEGTVEWFELAGKRYENLPVAFATEAKGAMADESLLGNIGGAMLKGRVLFIDYRNARFALPERDSAGQ